LTLILAWFPAVASILEKCARDPYRVLGPYPRTDLRHIYIQVYIYIHILCVSCLFLRLPCFVSACLILFVLHSCPGVFVPQCCFRKTTSYHQGVYTIEICARMNGRALAHTYTNTRKHRIDLHTHPHKHTHTHTRTHTHTHTNTQVQVARGFVFIVSA